MKSEQILTINEKLQKAMNPEDSYTFEDFYNDYAYENNMTKEEVMTDGFTISNGDFLKLNINYVNNSENPDPEYATEGSSGFDLRANLSESIVLGVGERVVVPTGLFFDIPNGMEIQIRSRSGLSIKHGVVVLNGIGTIDSDYTGEIGVILINHGENEFIINHGDRIAQGVISSVIGKQLTNFVKIATINKTTGRGHGGYGSTGHQ